MTPGHLSPDHAPGSTHRGLRALAIVLGCCVAHGVSASMHSDQVAAEANSAVPDGEDSLVIPSDESPGGSSLAAAAPATEVLRTGPASLDAAAGAASGTELTVGWTGPDNRNDYIAIAEPTSAGSQQLTYTYTRQGSPLTVRVPDAPGQYELRYIQGQSRTILQRQAFEVLAVTASLDAAAGAASGTELTVGWTGPDNRNDYIAIAEPTSAGSQQLTYTYTRQGSPLTVRVPDAPGQYELRYIQGQSRTILQRQAFEVLAVTASLDAAAGAASGTELTVGWTGPDNRNDYIAIAEPTSAGSQQLTYTYTRQGSPLTVRVPDAPGQYELRYIQGQSRTILQRQAFEVLAVTASLDAAAGAASGTELTVGWTGPDNRNDYIAIAEPTSAGSQQLTYTYTRQGSPLTVRVPDAPGQYELRYIQGQSRTILQRQAFEVLAVTASLDAAAGAASGTELTVGWTGPDNRNDYIAIAEPTSAGSQQLTYTYTRQGSPLTVRVPDAPGQYELRYIQGQSRTILQRQAFEVLAVTASLDAAAGAASGTELTVGWTGPDNRNDYIAIAEPTSAGSQQLTYTYTRQGSPLTVRVPDAPGQYELRYIQGQSRTILQRQSFEVTE